MILLAQVLQVVLQIQGLILQGFNTSEFDLKAPVLPSKDVWFDFEMMHHTIVLH
jgi:hypothetical protein